MAGLWGAIIPHVVQTVRVAGKLADEPNAYDDEVQNVIGVFVTHFGANHIYETRTVE